MKLFNDLIDVGVNLFKIATVPVQVAAIIVKKGTDPIVESLDEVIKDLKK